MDLKILLAILLQIAVSALVGFIYFKTSKKTLLGNLLGSIIVGIIGGVLVGFGLSQINNWIKLYLTSVDFVSTIFGSLILLWIYSRLSTH
jgi:uncharacterized membrane protein YeaQ/YmgE (transglycosylase-associated protein family)